MHDSARGGRRLIRFARMDEPVVPAVDPLPEVPVEPSAPASQPEPPPEPSLHKMVFTGTGSEYFRVWIVNLALTILTLGVYSAWAKVRRLQYFYRHTRLAGSGFDYHGEPFAILKGRMVGLVLFGLYSAISYVRFGTAMTILLVLALAVPWLLSRSLMFRLHNSSWRGIRFHFGGRTRSAYWVFLVLPFLTVLSLFLAGPFWHHRMKRFQFANAAYGQTPFEFHTEAGEFYITYVAAGAAAVAFGILLIIGLVGITTVSLLSGTGEPSHGPPQVPAGFFLLMFAGYVTAAVVVQSITAARLHNAVWSRTRLQGHGFICEVSWWRLFGIQWTNLVATILTLGLFRPFAQVRLSRYLASAFALVTAGSLDTLIAADAAAVSAIGEEAAGFFDLDIGF